MISSTHAAPCQWQFKQRKLPDPSLYRQVEECLEPGKGAGENRGADSLQDAPGVPNGKQARRAASLDTLLSPQPTAPASAQPTSPSSPLQPLTPPTSPERSRRRSLSALFHRH